MHETICYQLKNVTTLSKGMRIEEKLNEIKGVRAYVNVASGRATVYYDRRWVTEPELRGIVRSAGGRIAAADSGQQLFSAKGECVFELCDLAAKPEIPLGQLLGYICSLTAKQRFPFGKEIERIARANGVEPRRVKHLKRGKNAVSGVIDRHHVRCGSEQEMTGESRPDEDVLRLYLSIDGETVGYLEFCMTKVRV